MKTVIDSIKRRFLTFFSKKVAVKSCLIQDDDIFSKKQKAEITEAVRPILDKYGVDEFAIGRGSLEPYYGFCIGFCVSTDEYQIQAYASTAPRTADFFRLSLSEQTKKTTICGLTLNIVKLNSGRVESLLHWLCTESDLTPLEFKSVTIDNVIGFVRDNVQDFIEQIEGK